ncbi:iron chaperone [Flavobacterium sp. RNTU_13]|uniref:iron chaperone n=1 Tax=Flavobacterium sp. RNTU_13 TaxID=3375145 RepID=UPI00398735B5
MKNVDNYIAQFPQETQQVLNQVRAVIITTCPEAVENISYGMPAYKLNGKALVYFAGYKNHIGFYATPTGHDAFKEALAHYKQGKGSVQFPLTAPMPLELIQQIVLFRIKNIKNPK